MAQRKAIQVLYYNVKSCNKNNMVFREPSVVDDFHFKTGVSSDDNCPVTFVIDPIYEAFNLDRISQLGKMNVEAWFESLKQKPLSSLHQLREKCSDEQLISMMKSRYCQSPAQVAQWCDYMANNVDAFNAELSKVSLDKTNVESDKTE